jgi:sugar phosphate isomerase/epimerase
VHYGPARTPEGTEVLALWLWDATVPPPLSDGTPPDELREKYLLAVLVEDAGAWTVVEARAKRLRPALISSFLTRSVARVSNEWPQNPSPAVDFYALMQPEVDEWLLGKDLPSGPPQGDNYSTAVMAECASNRGVIDEWARSVCTRFGPDEKPIVAMASFFPEVTSRERQAYGTASRAVRFLVEFAEALRRQGHDGLRTVELVAGSRMGGVWPTGGDRYMATWMDADMARRRVLSILGRAMCEHAERPAESRICLAIELEPGPMYLLRDWQSLLRLCQEIDQDPLLSTCVGVNLDVAHWRLAGDITPQRVWDAPVVRNRISHAHLAGHHHCSHLGDLPPLDLNEAEHFRPWIELLQRIAADWRAPDLPQFSGYISLELEAARDRRVVGVSLQQLVDLM